MWRDHTFSQNKKATKKAGGRGWAKFEKKGQGKQYGDVAIK